MKEKYSKPAVVNAGTLEGTGLIPMVVAGVTIKSAAALLAGYVAGRAATKVMDARPLFKLPSFMQFKENDDDICLA